MPVRIMLDDDYLDHPKTVDLTMLLGEHAPLIPIRLWFWCARHIKDGDLRGRSDAQIERVLGWPGEGGKLIEILLQCGFIEGKKEGRRRVYNWGKRSGKGIKAYEDKKLRQQQAREDMRNNSGIVPEHSGNALAPSGSGAGPRPGPDPLSEYSNQDTHTQRSCVLQIFRYFQGKTGRQVSWIPSGPQYYAIRDRLTDGLSVVELKQAIDHICADPWPKRVNFREVEGHLFGTREKAEYWIRFDPEKASSNGGQRNYVREERERLERLEREEAKAAQAGGET